MEFKTQIATTIEQSRKLLELGLKAETADCCYYYYDGEYLIAFAEDAKYPSDIPAWSLHRLIEMMPEYVHKGNAHFERTLFPNSIDYFRDLYKDCGDVVISFDSPNLYDRLIHCVEWLIKEGYFNKEYLE